MFRPAKPETIARAAARHRAEMQARSEDTTAWMRAKAEAENDPDGFWTTYLAERLERLAQEAGR